MHELSLREAARLIRVGDLTAEAYAEALLDVCEAWRSLNAFISLDRDGVLRAARAADRAKRSGRAIGPLHGIPIAIKDVFDVPGTPTTAGTPAFRDHMPRRTARLVEILFDAGALMLGKTNLHEMAFGITSDNEFTGAVRNPYDVTMSAGGSSSGSAAAVAARMTPVALGSDTGGSIRIPAAHCGIVGFRPSAGRYSVAGMFPLNHTRDVPGLMARSVEDIAFLDQVLTGAEDPQRTDLRKVRIGLPRDYFLSALDRRTAAAMETEIERLAAFGAVFVSAAPPDFASARAATAEPIMTWEMPRDVGRYLVDSGSRLKFDELVSAIVSPYVKSELSEILSDTDELEKRYRHAVSVALPRHRAEFEAYLRDNDLSALAFPTTPLPPTPLGENETVTLNGRRVSVWATLRNCVPATLLGAPALSLPMAMTGDGLPLGLELDGWPGRDRELLALGLAWEREASRALPAPELATGRHAYGR
ncbi:MAG: amidase family protein [Gammaproteobacteria bacterium]